jgi:peptidyl-prolyl cis-trans isomerase D
MSVIQKIRDKYAVTIVVVICVAIVSFLLQDAFFGRNSMSQRSTTVGKVNGQELEYADYQQRITNEEQSIRQQSPNGNTDQIRQYAQERAWNIFLNEQIMSAQFDKLGVQVTEAEKVDQFFGKTPNPIVVQYFTNPQTGQFDPALVKQAYSNVSQDKTGRMRQMVAQLEEAVAKTQQQQKYQTLVKQGIYFPKWLAEQQIKDNSETATLSYVNVPYASIADSTIKVTDAELNKFIQDHKELFKVEESRKVEYVSFDALPSATDTAAAMKLMGELRAELDSTKDIAGFINRNSELKFFDGYVPKSSSMVPHKDSVVDLPIGRIYGPYFDGNTIAYAKMLDRKTLPDSAKIRFVLISTQQGLSDSIAKRRIDSVENAVRGGADFAAMVAQYSDDESTRANGGEFEMTPTTSFPVKEVKDFALEGGKGQSKVMKTPYGYFLVQVMEQKNFGPAVKVAYLAKTVDASKETDGKAYAAATEFAGKNKTQTAFDKSIQQEGLNKRIADNIRPVDFVIPGVGQSRELIRWAYEAKKGDVSNVFTFENKYVVAVLTSIRQEGVAPLDDVRQQVTAEVRKNKKAAQIMAKLQTPATLEDAAKVSNEPVLHAEGVSFATPFIATMGFEPRVVGASFNKNWGTTKVSAPIEGNGGVYVIKVDAYQPAAQPQDVATMQAAYEQGIKSMVDQQLFEILKKKSKVEDHRSKFL